MSADDKDTASYPLSPDTVTHPVAGLTLEVLAGAKRLSVEELKAFDCRDPAA